MGNLWPEHCVHMQGQRWQDASLQQTPSLHAESSAAATYDVEGKAELLLSIDSAEQLVAAEAVIAALYGTTDCCTQLPHDQLVHAVIIADIIDLPDLVN